MGQRLFLGKARVETVDENVGVNERGHDRTAPPVASRALSEPFSQVPVLAASSGAPWRHRRGAIGHRDPRCEKSVRRGITRMVSPAGSHSISTPGRIPYWLARALGTVTCSLLVTLAVSPYSIKDASLVDSPRLCLHVSTTARWPRAEKLRSLRLRRRCGPCTSLSGRGDPVCGRPRLAQRPRREEVRTLLVDTAGGRGRAGHAPRRRGAQRRLAGDLRHQPRRRLSLHARGGAPMKRAGRGAIVNISSGAGRSYSLTGIQAYASAKAGLIGFTRQTARELGRHGIRVNSVAPGFVRSNPASERQWDAMGEAGQQRSGRLDRAAPPRHARGHRPRRRLLRLRRRGLRSRARPSASTAASGCSADQRRHPQYQPRLTSAPSISS